MASQPAPRWMYHKWVRGRRGVAGAAIVATRLRLLGGRSTPWVGWGRRGRRGRACRGAGRWACLVLTTNTVVIGTARIPPGRISHNLDNETVEVFVGKAVPTHRARALCRAILLRQRCRPSAGGQTRCLALAPGSGRHSPGTAAAPTHSRTRCSGPTMLRRSRRAPCRVEPRCGRLRRRPDRSPGRRGRWRPGRPTGRTS